MRPLLVGALLLAAQAGHAQNSFNRWEARPVSPPAPRAAAVRRPAPLPAKELAVPQAPQVAKATLPAPPAQALVQPRRRAKDSLQVAQGYSMTLRRGLGQRLRAHKYSKSDSAFYMFTWQHLRYPPAALHAGLAGQVIVRLNVNPDGNVTESVVTGAEIQQETSPEKGASTAAGREAMRRSAQQLLWGLRFEPAPSSTQEEIPVRYVMQ